MPDRYLPAPARPLLCARVTIRTSTVARLGKRELVDNPFPVSNRAAPGQNVRKCFQSPLALRRNESLAADFISKKEGVLVRLLRELNESYPAAARHVRKRVACTGRVRRCFHHLAVFLCIATV